MLDRPDAVLVAIPLLGFGGIAVRSTIVWTGVGTGVLVVPLELLGVVAAATVILWELLTGQAGESDDSDRRDSTGLLARWR